MAPDHVTIVWSTRENLGGEVRYSTDQSFSNTAPIARVRQFPTAVTKMAQPFTQYQADLTGLTAGTQYSYRIVMSDGVNLTPDPAPQFRTASTGPFTFLVIGDSGAASAGQLQLAKLMNAENTNLVIHVGDIAYEEGTFDQFTNNYFEYYWPLMRVVPWFPVPGNHEYYTPNAAPYLALQANPTETVPFNDWGRYYSFDWGDVHFIALDSNLLDPSLRLPSAAMLDWLENDLQASDGAKWRIAYFHHLPYPIEHHLDDPVCAATRSIFVPMLERHNVQLVLAGHEHNYQHSKPMRGGQPVVSGRATIYMVSGGGGGQLHPAPSTSYLVTEKSVYQYLRVEVDSSQIVIHAIDKDGKEFDRTTLTRPSVPGPEAVVNAASFANAVAPGALISVFGQGLASDAIAASTLPLGGSMAGTSVTANGTTLPLVYVSPGQINAQLPLEIQSPVTLRVTTPSGSSETQINISDTAPAIFANGIWHNNGAAVSTTAPARPGDVLTIYMTGLGAVDGSLAPGAPAPSPPAGPLLNVVAPVEVEMGDVSVKPVFAGLTPGYVGLYQVNVVVPPDLPAKIYPLRVKAKGTLSNTQNVQVGSRTP